MSRRMGLAGSMGALSLWAMAVSASSPVTVLSGGIPTMYAATGVTGVPASFVVLMVALVPLTVGYVAASRHLGHAATIYALLARGLGRLAGTAGAAVALVSYTAILVSLFGLLGFVAADAVGGAWWVWALAAWGVVAVVGRFRVTANALFLTLGVAVQLAVLAAVVWVAVSGPAEATVTTAGLAPSALFVDGVGGVFAFGLAAFIGFESTTSYTEEAKSRATVGRATFAALLTLGILYATSAWAIAVGVGPTRVVDAARDPNAGLPFALLGGGAVLGVAVLIVAIVASMLSFHNLTARYLYALGRERVLPARLGQVGRGSNAGAPTTASLTQSVISLLVIVGVAATGGDPMATLFVPASTLAAIGVLALLVACSLATTLFFRRGGGGQESWLVRSLAPSLGVVTGLGVLGAMVANLHALLGVAPGAVATWVLPALIATAALVGVGWGVRLRRHHPEVYARIGVGQSRPLAQLDPRLVSLTT